MTFTGPEPFGGTPAGDAKLWSMENASGTRLLLSDYGARVVSLSVPERGTERRELALRLPSAEAYASDDSCAGAVCGRFANRIAGAAFTLDGVRYELPANDGRNCLHGGPDGFSRRVWAAERVPAGGVRFSLTSPDGDCGFPGEARVSVTYLLTDANEVRILYRAETDAPTPVNLTNHTYFNLDGEASTGISGHCLRVHSAAFLPVDAHMIPTGELRPVNGTAFDLREGAVLGERLIEKDPQLRTASGFDHCFAVEGTAGTLRPCAELTGESGLTLSILTTMPGVQVYTGNWLPEPRKGVALETQMFPDSPNRPEYPSCVVRPGEEMRAETVWRILRA